MRAGERAPQPTAESTFSCSGVNNVKIQLSAIRWAVLPTCLLAAAGLACQAGAAQSEPSLTQTAHTGPGLAQTGAGPAQTGAGLAQTGAPAALQVHVSGNKLVNGNGATVVLHGVDRSGAEYRCVQGRGIFDGPTDQASISAMKTWDINAVRLPLNEACWNGENYVNPAYAGSDYRAAIEAYVRLLNANGLIVILDLHWSDGAYNGPGCGSSQALCEKPMPDAAESVPFWSSVARAFKGDDAVIFDLFNEPHPGSVLGSETASWQCWLKGGSACGPGFQYKVAGMQTLVNTVRATGAKNMIMLGGLFFANDLSEWLKYEPKDPDHNLAASWHSYNSNHCNNLQCWRSQVGPVIASVPVIAGEIGENDCADGYIDPLMAWLDSKSTSYLAWSWNANPGGCAAGPELISDYSGTPTPYGAGYQAHLRSVASQHA
jgi:endoglucanase